MTALSKPVVLVTAACLLIGAAIYLAIAAPRSLLSPLSFTLIGFTNSPAQDTLAVFAVSNSNDRALNFFAALPQVCDTGVWERYIVRPPPAWGTDLAAHQQTQFSVAVPSNGEEWRVPVLWTFPQTRKDRVLAVVRANWLAMQDRRSLPGFHFLMGGAAQTNYTAAIRR